MNSLCGSGAHFDLIRLPTLGIPAVRSTCPHYFIRTYKKPSQNSCGNKRRIEKKVKNTNRLLPLQMSAKLIAEWVYSWFARHQNGCFMNIYIISSVLKYLRWFYFFLLETLYTHTHAHTHTHTRTYDPNYDVDNYENKWIDKIQLGFWTSIK